MFTKQRIKNGIIIDYASSIANRTPNTAMLYAHAVHTRSEAPDMNFEMSVSLRL